MAARYRPVERLCPAGERISDHEVAALYERLRPLEGVQFQVLRLPVGALKGFEPSQVGTSVGAIMDACIPQLDVIIPDDELVAAMGLTRGPGVLKDREGYPDFIHESGHRVELKLLYVPPDGGIVMKETSTAREPSARVGPGVNAKNVDPMHDVLLIVAYQLRPCADDPRFYSPTAVELGLFSIAEVVAARDGRLQAAGGFWFGDYQAPVIVSKAGNAKLKAGLRLDRSTYGIKEGEGKDYNLDTNFGKLARIPHAPLLRFLQKYGYKADPSPRTGVATIRRRPVTRPATVRAGASPSFTGDEGA